MRKQSFFIMFFLFIFSVFSTNIAHADMHEEQTDSITQINEDDVVDDKNNGQVPHNKNIWIPQKMIKGNQSYGMIILDKASNHNQLIVLSTTNPDIAEVQKNIVVRAHQNHGIFEIMPKSQGNIAISVVYDGNQFDAHAKVYSDAQKPSMLKLVAPGEKIKAEKINAAVYSLDDNGLPVAVEHNTRIKISSSENIQVPSDVVIQFGKDHVFFPVTVKGNGFVSVTSPGFESSEISLTKTVEDVDVNFDLAPNIAHSNSLVYFYLQLEKDGKPYRPPYVVDAFLTSSNEGVVSFSNDGRVGYEQNRIFPVSLVDGFAKGVAYTKGDGSAQLLANVPAFGFASSDLVVGKAVFNADVDQTPKAVVVQNNNTSMHVTSFEKSLSEKPTDLLMWMFPNPTDRDTYAVVGTYRIEVEKAIVLEPADNDEANPIQESAIYDQFTVTPILLDDGILAVSSSGNVNHENVYGLRQDHNVPISAIEIPFEGFGEGMHEVFTSSTGLDSASNEFEIVPKYDEEYRFQITALPFSAGGGENDDDGRKDIAMISIVDGTQSIVDVSSMSESSSIDLFASLQNSLVEPDDVLMYKNVHVITAEPIFEKDMITVASEKISPQTAEIMPSGIVSSVELDVPIRVHVGETFPYVVYDVDSNGVPLKQNLVFDFSASSNLEFEDFTSLKAIAASDSEDIIVMTEHGTSSQSVEVFENSLSFVSEIDTASARVNDDVLLRIISDVAGIDYVLESPFPHSQIDTSTFVITPDRELFADVAIIGTKDGYSAFAETIQLDAKKIVTVMVSGAATNGKNLSIPYTILSGDIDESFTSPFVHDLKTRDSVIEFPAMYHTPMGHGYAFESMRVNDELLLSPILETGLDKDLDITLNYQREVFIEIKGTDGGGVYEYGQTVSVSAPDVPKVWYFVKDTFDHWEGIDGIGSSISFNATQDMQITAVYREDHSLWMIIVLASAVSVIVLGLYKKNESARWMVNEYKEKLLKVASFVLSPKKAKNTVK